MRVLLVDDSAPVRERLRDLLVESAAADVSEAGSLEAACQLLKESPFDAAIVDVHLGAGSGLALIPIIRACQPGVLVVILTNDTTEAHRRECQRRGADLFFDKSREFHQAADAVRGNPGPGRTESPTP